MDNSQETVALLKYAGGRIVRQGGMRQDILIT